MKSTEVENQQDEMQELQSEAFGAVTGMIGIPQNGTQGFGAF